MKQINIYITKDEILQDVALKTAYTGVKSPEETNLYDRVAFMRHDAPLLNGFWNQSACYIADCLKNYMEEFACSDTAFSLYLNLSGSYDDAMTPALQTDIFSALSAGVIARWFKITCPDRAGEYIEESEAAVARALSRLCHRMKPCRPQKK